MGFVAGQGVLGRIRFVDGTIPAYDRTYLVVNVEADYIEVLNVSSIRGKEKKLMYPTNKALQKYNPPFRKPSFVKLDSLTIVPRAEWANLHTLSGGAVLDASEFSAVKAKLKT